jgi:hypothetical protein
MMKMETMRTATAQTMQTRYLPGQIQIRMPMNSKVSVRELIIPVQYVISCLVYILRNHSFPTNLYTEGKDGKPEEHGEGQDGSNEDRLDRLEDADGGD